MSIPPNADSLAKYYDFPTFDIELLKCILLRPMNVTYAAVDFVTVDYDAKSKVTKIIFKQCTVSQEGASFHFSGKEQNFKDNATRILNSIFQIEDHESFQVEFLATNNQLHMLQIRNLFRIN